MPGPPPTLTALKALRGNPGKHPIPEGEPMPSASTPRPPADLDAEALAEWDRIVPELESLGLVTVLDRAYLVAYCEAWSTFCLARRALAEGGPLVPGRDGGLVRNPAAQIMRDAADMMIKFGSRFGLSPGDRVRLAIQPAEPDGPDGQLWSLLS